MDHFLNKSRVLAVVLGAFLLATAALKVFSSAEAAALQAVYVIPRWLVVVSVQVELVIGLLLLSGAWPRFTWQVTVVLFVVFTAFSAYRVVAGFESCGCFGSLKVNPWWTLTFDSSVVVLMVRRRHEFNADGWVEARSTRRWLYMASYVSLGALSLIRMSSSGPIAIEAGKLWRDEGLVILEPNQWVGQSFPLGDYVSPEIKFSDGRWIILMYHHDCPKCQEAVPRYEQLASNLDRAKDAAKVLLLEVPPHGQEHLKSDGRARHAKLSDTREWFVQTPVEIVLQEGAVITVQPPQ